MRVPNTGFRLIVSVPGAECAAPDIAGDAEFRVEVLAGGQVNLQLVQHDRVRHLHTHVHSC
jgi:hypothetical protein